METHGNMYQCGFPDIFAGHRKYGQRWIEVKRAGKGNYSFTPAQLEWFPVLTGARVGIWILTNDTDYEIEKLFKPPNWSDFLRALM